MRCPDISVLPSPASDRTGWPWDTQSGSFADRMPNGEGWPKVSLVIPSFNQGQFLEETIRSILLQGYPDLECIVIDGGSNDNSVEIIKKYERWLCYWVSEKDQGQSHAINKGISLCTGKYFNWNNSDDVLTENSLSRCVTALEENPCAGGLDGCLVIINEKSEIVSKNGSHSDFNDNGGFMRDFKTCIPKLKCGNQPGGLMDLSLVRLVGGVDENIHYSMDTDLQLRMMLYKPFYHLNYPVIMYRTHSESKTESYVGRRATERILIAKKLVARSEMQSKEYSYLKKYAYRAGYNQAYYFSKLYRRYFYAIYYFCALKVFDFLILFDRSEGSMKT